MSILVYTESENGKFKKSAFEVASYAKAVADQMGTTATAISFNASEGESLGNYGVSKVLNISNDQFNTFNAEAYAKVIAQAVESEGATTVIVSSSANAKYLAPLLAAKLKAGYAPNVVEAPSSTAPPLTVKRTAFSNKGFAHTEITTDKKIIGVSNNAFGIIESGGSASVEEFSAQIEDADFSVTSLEVDKVAGKVSIADADIVVSGGRGLKGPKTGGEW